MSYGTGLTRTRRARAPRWVTIVNPVARTLLKAGAPLGVNALVTVRGRKSGLPRSTPLAIIKVEDGRWIWAPWGDVDWVRNLRVAGRATVKVRGHDEDVIATELDATQRIAFFRDTLGPFARSIPFGYWFARMVDGTDLDDPVGAAEGRAVFELHPAT